MKIKPFYYRFRIKDQIFSIMLLLLIVLCIIGIFIINYFSKMYEDEIYKESAKILQLSSSVLDKELSKMEKLSFQIATDNFVQQSLVQINNNQFDYEVYRTKSKLIDGLVSFATQEKYIASIQIVDTFGSKYTAGYNTKIKVGSAELLPLALNREGANVWFGFKNQNIVTSARLIRGKENLNLKHLGTLFITIDVNKMIQDSLDFPANNDFVIAKDEEIIYMSDFNEIDSNSIPDMKNGSGYETKNIDGNDYLVAFHDSSYSDLTYYHFLPFDNITNQTTMIKKWMVLCFLFMLVFTIFLSKRAATVLSLPMEELAEKMKQVQKGKFERPEFKEELFLNNEVGELHRNFQIMIDEINVLIKENYKKQLIIKETEYQALQAQINPHFLYNTLDSINWMAKLNKQPNISIMAESLGNMMRNIISKKAPLITIKDELEIVSNYVTIQKYRYNERLKFTLQHSSDVEDFLIPKLSIQPIIENAIQHGLEELVSGSHILLNIYTVDNDNLHIVIEDNGPGMDEITIQSIFNGDIKPKGTGIGIRNINERIKIMFGTSYGIHIESKVGIGTKVIIKLPCRME